MGTPRRSDKHVSNNELQKGVEHYPASNKIDSDSSSSMHGKIDTSVDVDQWTYSDC